jgi:uncharacterized membrane protein (DUF2068 family)
VQTTTAQRPLGITILAILAIIGGVLGILGSFAVIALAGVAPLLLVFGILGLIVAVVELAFGIGAWTLKPWAWMLGIVSQAVSIIINLIQLLAGNTSLFSALLNIVIAGVILYYLNTPEVKRAFGRP